MDMVHGVGLTRRARREAMDRMSRRRKLQDLVAIAIVVFCLVATLFCIWIAASVINVMMTNMPMDDAKTAVWNIFVVFSK